MSAFYTHLAALAEAGWLPASLGYPFVVRGVLAVLVLGPLLGGMSHLVVARRLAFLSTALGQAALTGLTIGLVLGEPLNAPYGGIFGFCLLSAIAWST
jgi:zinc transport system permease protein